MSDHVKPALVEPAVISTIQFTIYAWKKKKKKKKKKKEEEDLRPNAINKWQSSVSSFANFRSKLVQQSSLYTCTVIFITIQAVYGIKW